MPHYFTLIIVIAALPLGANRPWAWSLYAILIAMFGLALAIKTLRSPSTGHLTIKPLRYPLLFMILPLLWSLLQMSPLTPIAWHHPFWALSHEVLASTNAAYISLLPHETGTALMRLLSYGLVFLLSYQYNQNSDRNVVTFKIIAYASVAYAVYGLVIQWGQFNTLLWFDKKYYRDLVTSTFVNRNSYATYAGLGLLASFPLLFTSLQAGFKYGLSSPYGRQYFIENLIKQGWQPLFGMMLIATALLLTESRGGFISTLLAVILFFLVLQISHKMPSNKAFISLLLVAAITAGWVFNISGDAVLTRMDGISLSLVDNDRLRVYEILSKANQDNPWLGNGYGSFANTFKLYQDESIPGYYDKAHNSYLENIFELGFIPAIALFSVLVSLAIICLRGVWIRRRHWIYPAIGVAATVLVGTHALVDFSLQIPAVAYLYALMMGGAVAQARTSA